MKKLSSLSMSVSVVIVAIFISAFCSYVLADSYSAPSTNPPGGNISAPINTSGSGQIKSGGLTVNLGGGTNGLIVASGKVGIGTINPAHSIDVVATGADGIVQAVGFYYASDWNLKQNILPLKDSLNKITQLQGVSYNWKSSGAPDVGLIAQDVQKVYPQLVTSNATGLAVDYGHLIGPMIEAIKTQQLEIDQLKAEIEAIKAHR